MIEFLTPYPVVDIETDSISSYCHVVRCEITCVKWLNGTWSCTSIQLWWVLSPELNMKPMMSLQTKCNLLWWYNYVEMNFSISFRNCFKAPFYKTAKVGEMKEKESVKALVRLDRIWILSAHLRFLCMQINKNNKILRSVMRLFKDHRNWVKEAVQWNQ